MNIKSLSLISVLVLAFSTACAKRIGKPAKVSKACAQDEWVVTGATQTSFGAPLVLSGVPLMLGGAIGMALPEAINAPQETMIFLAAIGLLETAIGGTMLTAGRHNMRCEDPGWVPRMTEPDTAGTGAIDGELQWSRGLD